VKAKDIHLDNDRPIKTLSFWIMLPNFRWKTNYILGP